MIIYFYIYIYNSLLGFIADMCYIELVNEVFLNRNTEGGQHLVRWWAREIHWAIDSESNPRDSEHVVMNVVDRSILFYMLKLVGGLVAIFGIFPLILGISSSQLTFIFFRGVAQPPTSYILKHRDILLDSSWNWMKGKHIAVTMSPCAVS